MQHRLIQPVLFITSNNIFFSAKTGVGKSLIFQLLPFITPIPGVLLVLMPLKLLQAEQRALINRFPTEKAIVLNGENNQKDMQLEIAQKNYIHIFINPEIAFSKNFKKNILDSSQFTDCLCLFAINEIHLIENGIKAFGLFMLRLKRSKKEFLATSPLAVYQQP